jgi:hypothetical protein
MSPPNLPILSRKTVRSERESEHAPPTKRFADMHIDHIKRKHRFSNGSDPAIRGLEDFTYRWRGFSNESDFHEVDAVS